MENTQKAKVLLREKLLDAGIDELYQHGFDHFSVRRIASQCGVSCAAPYKHFADKQAFIDAIFAHINQQWLEQEQRTITRCLGSAREKLLSVCEAYIRFLVEHPHFRAILMTRYGPRDSDHPGYRTEFNAQTADLVADYFRSMPMDSQTRQRKLFVTRSLIYGAALLFDIGDLPYTEENLHMALSCIEREFDLP